MEAAPKALGLAFTALGLMLLAVHRGSPALAVAASALLVILAYMAGVAEGVSEAMGGFEASRFPEHVRVVEGDAVHVTLRLRNATQRVIHSITLREGLPETLKPEGGPAVYRGSLEGFGGVEASYTVRPPPGLHRIEYVDVEAGDPLGLYKSRTRLWATTTIQAYPRPLSTAQGPARRLGLAEAVASRRRGWGLEFYSLRDYQPGDDPRLIAWLPSGRAGRPLVRENVEERALDVCVFLDLSLESWAGGPWGSSAAWIMRSALGILEASASTGGWACYTAYLGESTLRMPPTRAPEVLEWLAEQLSSVSPSHAVPRKRLARAVERFESEAPRSFYTLYLLGPGASLDAAEALAAAPTRWRAVAVAVMPHGSRLAEALAEAYRRIDSPGVAKLRASGIPAYIAGSPPALLEAVAEGLSEVARRAPIIH